MRPQQNRRMRGRSGNGNQNRKGPNPLTRNYESNGPDVKIRGSAQQIAEKYAALARDAQSSGDRVMAENYLQHAEHYNRIIMTAQAQMPQHQARDTRDDDEIEEDGEDGFAPAQAESSGRQQQQSRAHGSGPQPVIEGVPAEVALKHDTSGDASDDRPATDKAAPEAGAEGAGASPRGDAEGEAPEAPRRARRPRRPRLKAGEEAAAGEQAPAGGEEPVTEAAQ